MKCEDYVKIPTELNTDHLFSSFAFFETCLIYKKKKNSFEKTKSIEEEVEEEEKTKKFRDEFDEVWKRKYMSFRSIVRTQGKKSTDTTICR